MCLYTDCGRKSSPFIVCQVHPGCASWATSTRGTQGRWRTSTGTKKAWAVASAKLSQFKLAPRLHGRNLSWQLSLNSTQQQDFRLCWSVSSAPVGDRRSVSGSRRLPVQRLMRVKLGI